MLTQASMEHIDHLRRFEERAKEAKAAAELREATKLEEAQNKLIDNIEDELQEDLDRLEIIRARRHILEEQREGLMKNIKSNLGFNQSTEKNDEKTTEEKSLKPLLKNIANE